MASKFFCSPGDDTSENDDKVLESTKQPDDSTTEEDHKDHTQSVEETENIERQDLPQVLSNGSRPVRPQLGHVGSSCPALERYATLAPRVRSTSPPVPQGFEQILQQMSLRSSSPDVTQLWLQCPFLLTRRYERDFQEFGILGQGGYGKVYHVRNLLDQADYAIKKVALNASRVKRIRERGQAELDVLLAEVVALAHLDHPNIVRYHGAWLQYEAPDDLSTSPPKSERRPMLLAGPEIGTNRPTSNRLRLEFLNMEPSFSSPANEPSLSGGSQVIFEASQRSTIFPRGPVHRRIQSLDSTLKSPKKGKPSRLANQHELSEEDGDEERPDSQKTESMRPEVSVRMTAECPSEKTGPHLLLHLQMGLYPLNLATFLIPGNLADPVLHPRHCFHLQVSLRIFMEILDGVEYLHSNGMIHRDLKPSNIFMSISSKPPYKYVDLSTCKDCGHTDGTTSGHFLNLRIGDFGLVSDLERPESAAAATPTKAVGTVLYRPQFLEEVSKSLDVFALGVTLFELLCPFSTKMERQEKLQLLRRGSLPVGFLASYGEIGLTVAGSIKAMVNADPNMRPSCAGIRAAIGALIECSKALES